MSFVPLHIYTGFSYLKSALPAQRVPLLAKKYGYTKIGITDDGSLSGFAPFEHACKDAGVTNGAFYAHFDSKEDLFDKIVRSAVDGMQELYDEENSSFMDIRSAEDVGKAIHETIRNAARWWCLYGDK